MHFSILGRMAVYRAGVCFFASMMMLPIFARGEGAVQEIPINDLASSSAWIPRNGDFSSATAQGVVLVNNSQSPVSFAWTNLSLFLVNSNASLIFECSGTQAGVDYPQVTASEVLFFGPTQSPLSSRLELRPVNGFVPAVGDQFRFFRFGVNQGAFRSIIVPPPPTNGVWRISYLSSGVVVGLYPVSDAPSMAISGNPLPESFQFRVDAPIGRPFILDASTNLTDWLPLVTNSAFSGWQEFRNQFATNPALYYRVRGVPPPPIP